MEKMEQLSQSLNNIFKKSNMTLEETVEFLSEYRKEITEELAVNATNIINETESIEEKERLIRERQELEIKEAVVTSKLDELAEIMRVSNQVKTEQANTNPGPTPVVTPEPARTVSPDQETSEVYTQIQVLINTIINLKEDEKIYIDRIVGKCDEMIISDDSRDYAHEAQSINRLSANIDKLLTEEITVVYPKLRELFGKLTPEQRAKFKDFGKNIISNNPDKVKEQYRKIAKKIIELDDKIKNPNTKPEQIKDYEKIKKALIDSIEYLKGTLEYPELFNDIKKQVDEELAKERNFIPEPTPVVTPVPTSIETPEPTPVVTPEPTIVVNPVGEGTSNGSGDGSSTSTTEEEPVIKPIEVNKLDIDGDETPEPTPVVTPEPTPVVTPIPVQFTQKEIDPAKLPFVEQYKNYIKMMNSIVLEIEKLNEEIDAMISAGDLTSELRNGIIKRSNRIKELNDRLFDLSIEKSDYEFTIFKEQNFVITNELPPFMMYHEEVMYHDDLVEFYQKHNAQIEKAYEKINQINEKFATVSDENKAKYKEAVDSLFEYINAEKDIITRRLVAERKYNYNFDIVAFINNNRVKPMEIKPVEAPTQTTEQPQVEQQEQPKEEPVVNVEEERKEFTELMEELCKAFIVCKYEIQDLEFSLYTKEQEASKKAELEKETLKISESIKDLMAKYTSLSTDEKAEIYKASKVKFEERYSKLSTVVEATAERRKQLKQDYLELCELAANCREKSPEGKQGDGFSEAYVQVLNKRKQMEEKYGKDVKITLDSNTKEITISYSLEYEGQTLTSKSESIQCLGIAKTQEETKKKTTAVKVVSIKPILNLDGLPVDAKKAEAIAREWDKSKIEQLKKGVKTVFTEGLKREIADVGLMLQTQTQLVTEDGKVVGSIESSTMKM